MRDLSQEYERNFKGMTSDPLELPTLLAAREQMMHELQSGLDAEERRFLLSLVANQPEWPLLGIEHLDQLPGIRWKIQNLGQLQKANARKFAEQAEMLTRLLA